VSLMIGWKEYVEFPDWGIRWVKAKIDTGARTSALDAAEYELLAPKDGRLVVKLRLILNRKRPEKVRVVEVPVLRLVMVRNSGGFFEQRPLIETTLRLGPVSKRIRFTVANRARMIFPVILGRKALEGDFVVNVSQKYLLGRKHGPGSEVVQ